MRRLARPTPCLVLLASIRIRGGEKTARQRATRIKELEAAKHADQLAHSQRIAELEVEMHADRLAAEQALGKVRAAHAA